jgi:sugar transferase (PEP-CTERM/EpsH1 system associated)
MKILFICPYVPNLIRVRSYQLLRSLVQRGHNVTLATLWTSSEERADLQSLIDMGIAVIAQQLPRLRSLVNVIRTLPIGTPLQADFCWQPSLAQIVQQLALTGSYDVIHVEHLRAAKYGLHLRTIGRQHDQFPPVVWDSVDCISYLFEQAAEGSRSLKGRLMTRLDLARTRSYEGYLVRQFDQVLVTSPADKVALEKLAEDSLPHVHVVPNGVDLDYFAPNGKQRDPATIAFSGKMSYHANITAALHLINDIMPKVWAQHPEVKVMIVGKDPAPEICALANKKSHRKGQVIVTGTVPDIRPYLHQSSVAVAPVPYGAGIQNKVLEAMACGSAVIASPQACSALATQSGRDLLVADTPEQFASSLLDLLAHPGQQRVLGSSARSYVEEYHSWNTMVARLEQIYQTAIQSRTRLTKASIYATE